MSFGVTRLLFWIPRFERGRSLLGIPFCWHQSTPSLIETFGFVKGTSELLFRILTLRRRAFFDLQIIAVFLFRILKCILHGLKTLVVRSRVDLVLGITNLHRVQILVVISVKFYLAIVSGSVCVIYGLKLVARRNLRPRWLSFLEVAIIVFRFVICISFVRGRWNRRLHQLHLLGILGRLDPYLSRHFRVYELLFRILLYHLLSVFYCEL